jgi:hypothetical protein
MQTDPRTKLAARDCGSFIESLLISRFAVCRDYGSGGSVLEGFGPAIPVATVTVAAVISHVVALPSLLHPVVVRHAADAPVGLGTY